MDWTRQFGPLMLTSSLRPGDLASSARLFSAMTVNLRLRELMLPMLVYPILIPCLLGAIQLTAALLAGKPIESESDVWAAAAGRL